MEISKNIFYIGANDEKADLFEGQYNVPNGMSYNSYLIKDEKNVLLDTVDKSVTDIWLKNLEDLLAGENLDFLVVSHMEPDHAYNIGLIAKKYPNMKIIGNTNTFNMLTRFFDLDLTDRKIIVKEGDSVNIGSYTMQFFMAPMVHWPEVMFTYIKEEQILFTSDAFGKFGIVKDNDKWLDEARRYYIGIVGKYGMQVQNILKKAANLEIKTICPLHGPILKENLNYYIEKYNIWSSYTPEEEGILIACSSIHGNTLNAAKYLEELLKNQNKKVELMDLTKCDMAEAVAKAFKYSKLIIASSSYNAGLFPPMEHFLNKLEERNYQKRKVAIIENGTWAPSSGKIMKNIILEMKEIELIEPIITIESTLKDKTKDEFNQLAQNF